MAFIVVPYHMAQDSVLQKLEIYKNEQHFIDKTGDLEEKHDLKMPVDSLEDAVAVYNIVYGSKHCLVTKRDYQSSKQWSQGVIKAARSLGWFHTDLDWIYKPVPDEE